MLRVQGRDFHRILVTFARKTRPKWSISEAQVQVHKGEYIGLHSFAAPASIAQDGPGRSRTAQDHSGWARTAQEGLGRLRIAQDSPESIQRASERASEYTNGIIFDVV